MMKGSEIMVLSVDSVSNWKLIFSIYFTWSHLSSYHCS